MLKIKILGNTVVWKVLHKQGQGFHDLAGLFPTFHYLSFSFSVAGCAWSLLTLYSLYLLSQSWSSFRDKILCVYLCKNFYFKTKCIFYCYVAVPLSSVLNYLIKTVCFWNSFLKNIQLELPLSINIWLNIRLLENLSINVWFLDYDWCDVWALRLGIGK